MGHHSIVCAGIDTGKHTLDVAIDGRSERLQVDNGAEGHQTLSAWLRQYKVERVGIEASGGYEQAVVSSLRADGFVVVVFQPAEVRAYARFARQHAKNEQAAAIAGLAPFDDDSGLRRGLRHIKGGRQRLRKSLYAAALPAVFYWNPQLKALYQRLRAAGKSHKLALVACARKLLIFVNTVVARGLPWRPAAATP